MRDRNTSLHIARITLGNFRGAASLDLPLHPRLNLFIGENGAGKSTILDAAAIMCSWVVNKVKTPTAGAQPIIEADINNRATNASILMDLALDGKSHAWEIVKFRPGVQRGGRISAVGGAAEVAALLRKRYSALERTAELPVFLHYPTTRTVADIGVDPVGRQGLDPLAAYAKTYVRQADFAAFFQWFRRREDLENENRVREAQPSGASVPGGGDRQLEAVRRALGHCLPGLKNIRVRRDPLAMVMEKGRMTLTANQLSHGEKCLLALVGDIARHLAMANTELEDPLQGSGVIMIDEVELHLHPRWQREVVPNVAKAFPRCQFLISTHSPQVATHVEAESVFLLKATEKELRCDQPPHCFGKSSERILKDLMGIENTRPDRVARKLAAIYRRLDDNDLDGAERAIDKLANEIGDDPELSRLRVYAQRRRVLGRRAASAMGV